MAGAVLTALATSAAATESHGDWLAFMSNDATAAYAVTTNDSGHILGAFCSSGGAPCEWRISIPLACEADAEYPALASVPHGAAHLTLRCLGPLKGGNYRYGFIDDKETPLSANMSETVTPWKFSVEGEQGSEVDERRRAGSRGAGDRGRGEGDAAAVHRRVQAEDRPRGRRMQDPGAMGALLRREGLYSSHLATWRAARDRGELAGCTKKRGPLPQVADARDKVIAEQAREIARWKRAPSGPRRWSNSKKNWRRCWGRRSNAEHS